MKKSIIAISLLSVFSAGAMANDMVIDITKNLTTDTAQKEISRMVESGEVRVDSKGDFHKLTIQEGEHKGKTVIVGKPSSKRDDWQISVDGESAKIDVNGNDEILIDGEKVSYNEQIDLSDIGRAAAAVDTRIDTLEMAFNNMAEAQKQQSIRIDQNEGKMSNGIAGVAAMANIPTVSGKTTFGAGLGSFNGSNALAIGASTGFENGVSLKGSVSYASGKFSQKDVVVGAGIGYSF